MYGFSAEVIWCKSDHFYTPCQITCEIFIMQSIKFSCRNFIGWFNMSKVKKKWSEELGIVFQEAKQVGLIVVIFWPFLTHYPLISSNLVHMTLNFQITCSWLKYIKLRKNNDHWSLRSSLPEVFCKKGVLRNFSKFVGKHQC